MVAGEQVLVGASAGDLAQEIGRVLADGDLAARLGSAAREHVRSRHDWSAVARRYVRVWEGARLASSAQG